MADCRLGAYRALELLLARCFGFLVCDFIVLVHSYALKTNKRRGRPVPIPARHLLLFCHGPIQIEKEPVGVAKPSLTNNRPLAVRS